VLTVNSYSRVFTENTAPDFEFSKLFFCFKINKKTKILIYMNTENEILESAPDREIVNKRIINAPRETVYNAWTYPEHLINWWGPKGYTNTFIEFDLRPSGKWNFVMHGPEGENYINECIFLKIIPPELIIWNHLSFPKFQMVASFRELQGKTEVTFKMVFKTAEECDKIKLYMYGKNEENLDKLEEEIGKMIYLHK
jgi:uncharacterized protein YndB with AHSA1/START domain